jgi:hypothetical protein
MYKRAITTTLLGLSFTAFSFAGTMEDNITTPPLFYIGAYGGYGTVSGGYKNDGNVAQGRFELGAHIKEYKLLMLGGELGIQSGNTMRLDSNSSVVDPTTGLPPQAVLKPVLDLLFTIKGQFQPDKNFFYILKAGIAYRQLQLQDRTANSDNLTKVAPEFQAGLGIKITKNVLLNAFYQGIYSTGNAGVYLDSGGNTSITYIPTQQAVFLGLEYSFF